MAEVNAVVLAALDLLNHTQSHSNLRVNCRGLCFSNSEKDRGGGEAGTFHPPFYNLIPQALMLIFDNYYSHLPILKGFCTLIFKLASHGPKYLSKIPFQP